MRPRSLLLLPLALALAACQPTTPPDPVPGPASIATTPAAQADRLLTGFHWRLRTATDGTGQRIAALFGNKDAPLQLDFSEGRVGVSGGCNRQGGSYRLDGDRLTVGPLMQTEMACAEQALMTQDAAIGRVLEGNPQWQLVDGGNPTLTLTTADGGTLVFAGEPTADTRYGGPGETVFLEVAAQRQPCSHPLIPDHRCLQVREVEYAESGIRTGAGEWTLLYQDIEGYDHQPGVRNVLRLKRFDLPDPPADGTGIVYVLDMVVESELVD